MATRSQARTPIWPRNRRTTPHLPAGPRPESHDGSDTVQGRHTARDVALHFALLAVGLCGLLVTVALALWAHDVPHAGRDVTLEAAARAHMPPLLTAFIFAISRLGNVKAIALTMALLLGWFALRRQFAQAVTLFASVAGGAVLTLTLKPLVGRLAPTMTTPPTGPFAFNLYAFPSGHAVYFITCCVPLIYFLWQWRPQAALDVRIFAETFRVLACVALLALIALGGFAQIYFAYHWPSDVAGGYIIGGFWTALVLLAYTRVRGSPGPRWTPRQRKLPIHPHL